MSTECYQEIVGLYDIWPQVDEATVIRFVKDTTGKDITVEDIKECIELTLGFSIPELTEMQEFVEIETVRLLSRFGVAGITSASILIAIEKDMCQLFPKTPDLMVLKGWVDEAIDGAQLCGGPLEVSALLLRKTEERNARLHK